MSELPDSWTTASIEELFAPLEDGRTLHQGWSPQCEKDPSSDENDWGVLKTTAIQPGSFKPEFNKRLPDSLSPRPLIEVNPGDILLTCAGPRARCGVACLVRSTRRHLMMSGKMYRFRVPAQYIDARFLEAYLQTAEAQMQIDDMKTGGSDSGLNLTHDRFRRLTVPVAPINEQQRIVATIEEQFSRIDAGVAALERVRLNVQRIRAASLDMLHYDDVGNQWPLSPLGHVLIAGRYGTSTKCAYEGKGLPVLRIPNIQSGLVSLTDLKYASDPSVDLSRAIVRNGDVLVIRTNGSRSLIGRAAIVRDLRSQAAFASYLIQLRIDSTLLDPAYLVATLASPKLRAHIEQLAATTAGQYNINLAKLRALRIPVPPLAEQLRSLAVVQQQLCQADLLQATLERISSRSFALRSSILTAAVSGKLVPQDLSDEPASILLERMAAERQSSTSNHHSGKSRQLRLPA